MVTLGCKISFCSMKKLSIEHGNSHCYQSVPSLYKSSIALGSPFTTAIRESRQQREANEILQGQSMGLWEHPILGQKNKHVVSEEKHFTVHQKLIAWLWHQKESTAIPSDDELSCVVDLQPLPPQQQHHLLGPGYMLGWDCFKQTSHWLIQTYHLDSVRAKPFKV